MNAPKIILLQKPHVKEEAVELFQDTVMLRKDLIMNVVNG